MSRPYKITMLAYYDPDTYMWVAEAWANGSVVHTARSQYVQLAAAEAAKKAIAPLDIPTPYEEAERAR